ncbi:MAG TPA: DUF2461 domain-containing protein [Actinomycetota bacterium]|nr:DUF2461 domain-containing protein [Actinomycetota bacterium]
MAFRGWPIEAVEFYEGLEADNTKAYWTAHKPVYESRVYAPMAALLEELAGEFGPARIARPYRDVRFRADKSPYKTAIYAVMERGGYVHFGADGLTAGVGYYQMAPDQLDRYRHAVADDRHGAELAGIIDRLTTSKIEVGGSSSLKSAPRGYPRDHPRIELLRHKGLIAWRHWDPASWLQTAGAKRRVVEFLRVAAPLQDWLDDHVGPTTAPPR